MGSSSCRLPVTGSINLSFVIGSFLMPTCISNCVIISSSNEDRISTILFAALSSFSSPISSRALVFPIKKSSRLVSSFCAPTGVLLFSFAAFKNSLDAFDQSSAAFTPSRSYMSAFARASCVVSYSLVSAPPDAEKYFWNCRLAACSPPRVLSARGLSMVSRVFINAPPVLDGTDRKPRAKAPPVLV